MERAEYGKLNLLEDEMWWFRGLHENMLAAYRRRGPDGTGRLLDAGCGTGGFIAKLSRAAPRSMAIGLDADAEACAVARAKSGASVLAGSVNRLPFANGTLRAIFSADVLCHRNVDEAEALDGFHRCLAPGGLLVLNLPAYSWLLSDHDRAVHNVRRYTARRAERLLQQAGFVAIEAGYWNTALFPLMVLRRILGTGHVRSGRARSGQANSDVMKFPVLLDRSFGAALRVERALLSRGRRFPFGGSVIATALKAS